MIIYHTNDKFTIWEDKDYFYYIQMAGCEVEQKAYSTAAEAICQASDR